MTWESGISPVISWRNWKKIKPPCCIFTTRLVLGITKPVCKVLSKAYTAAKPLHQYTLYFISQVRGDYMQHCASKVSDGMALQLGCLEIRYQHSVKLCSNSKIVICLLLHYFSFYIFKGHNFLKCHNHAMSPNRRYYKNMNANGLEKKTNFELLE